MTVTLFALLYVLVAYLTLMILLYVVLKCHEDGAIVPPNTPLYFLLLSVFWPITFIGTAYNIMFGKTF